ncbi:hypothetical protein B0H12DRAFT_526716 [Mycena haematopus]|nr:hypothetical protein B0H12DRAFT_526716 [Mycena haematopus]
MLGLSATMQHTFSYIALSSTPASSLTPGMCPPFGSPFLGHYLTIVQEGSCILSPQLAKASAYRPVASMMGILGRSLRKTGLNILAHAVCGEKKYQWISAATILHNVLGLVASIDNATMRRFFSARLCP